MPFIRNPVSALRPVRLRASSDAGRHRALVDTPHRACRSQWTEASRVLRFLSCAVWCVHVARCRVTPDGYRPHMGELLPRMLYVSLPAESGTSEGRAGRQAGASSWRIRGTPAHLTASRTPPLCLRFLAETDDLRRYEPACASSCWAPAQVACPFGTRSISDMGRQPEPELRRRLSSCPRGSATGDAVSDSFGGQRAVHVAIRHGAPSVQYHDILHSHRIWSVRQWFRRRELGSQSPA